MPTRKQTTIYYLIYIKKTRAIYCRVQQGMSSHFPIVHSSGRKSFELWLFVYQFFHTYMLFTGCEVRMRKTVPAVLKTARARRARDVFKTKGTVFLIRTEAASK